MPKRFLTRWLILVSIAAVFVVILSRMDWWNATLQYLLKEKNVIYPGVSLLSLVGQHMLLVAVSSGFTVLVGMPLGIFVTRRIGRSFQPLVSDFTSLGQTFPPVAVLALAVPLLGFGWKPTIVALFLYGLLPVVRNTTTGLMAVPGALVDTAYGMGMGRVQTLARVEIPMASRVIIAGIRISVVINIGTAMIGALIGAGGLGVPIVAGLVQFNTAYVIEGALPAAILAIIADQFLLGVEKSFGPPEVK